MTKKYLGIVFDVDGVITETASFHFHAWKEILKEFQIDYQEKDNDAIKGLPRRATLEAILKMQKKELSEAEITYILEAKNKLYVKTLEEKLSQKNVLPGIKNFLETLKKDKIKMSIASSSFNAPLILKKVHLEKYFDYIVYPGDVKKGKPNPEIFTRAIKGINLNPEKTYGIEDAIEGAKGLRASGAKVICITHGVQEEWNKYCHLIYHSTSELNWEFLKNHS